MADAFDQWLADSLAPEDRLADRNFVARLQARMILEERLAAERRKVVASFGTQLAALLAVAAAIWTIGNAAPVAELFARFPGICVAGLLAAFALVVAMFSSAGRPSLRSAGFG